MRKIETQEIREKRAQRSKAILSILLVGLMMFSTLGYALYYTSSSPSSESLEDVYFDGVNWIVRTDFVNLYLQTNPLEKESVSEIDLNVYNYAGKLVYVDIDNELIRSEFFSNMGQVLSLQEACYGSCERDLPEKDCSEPLFVWKESQEERIYASQECTFIEGDISTIDLFMYDLLT